MSQENGPPENASWNDDHVARNQRITAIRELAGSEQVTSMRAANSPMPRASADKRRWPALLIALVVVLASAGAAWKGLFPWQQHQHLASNITSVNLAATNLFCPSAASWSPDGRQVAVLARVGTCGNADGGILAEDAVAFFDIHGHLVRQIDVDASIPGYKSIVAPSSLVHPRFWGLVWAPDGKQVALPFSMAPGLENTAPVSESGVVLAQADGTTAQAIISPTFYGNDYWSIQAQLPIHGNTNWPFSVGYQWSADGTLVASHPFATTPVGNPSGGQSFTIWQPGTVVLDREKSALYFGGNLTVWSPNGRYLIPALGFGGYLDPTATDYKQGSDGQYHLAPRDKGLMAAAGRLKDPTDPYAAQISVAWRADGKLIAATDPNPLIDQVVANLGSDIPAVSQSVTIFDCVTRAKLLALKTHPLANRISNFGLYHSSPALGWNAKGDKLFFLDTNFDMLTIWNVSLK